MNGLNIKAKTRSLKKSGGLFDPPEILFINESSKNLCTNIVHSCLQVDCMFLVFCLNKLTTQNATSPIHIELS